MNRFLPIFCFVLLSTTAIVQTVTARDAVSNNPSPYINKVYEYMPAPGQFVNVLPAYEEGNSADDMLQKVAALIVDTIGTSNYISLGGWGGYVTFGFDHTIVNVAGQADFEVGGNAFTNAAIPNPYDEKNATGTFSHDSILTGSAEPGIIWVSRDKNGNGQPDDEWYEIAGSEYPYSTTGYTVNYKRPAGQSDDVVGIDVNGDTILIKHNAFHAQIYYPSWLSEDEYTLSGTVMPNNLKAGTITLLTMDYGYADNVANGKEANGIDIDWAVDADGQPVHLDGIDFVRVQTGVAQDGGIMGETSTEVTGARDLHVDVVLAVDAVSADGNIRKRIENGHIIIERDGKRYSVLGQTID